MYFTVLFLAYFNCSHPFFVCSDTGSLRLAQDKFRDDEDDDDAGGAVRPASALVLPSHPVYEGPLPTPPQKAFQAGSTPAHLTHRFMVKILSVFI